MVLVASETTSVFISDDGGEDQPSLMMVETDFADVNASLGKLLLIVLEY